MDRSTYLRWAAKAEVQENGCILWTGAKGGGYGQLSVNGQMKLAHRIAYEHFVGPIPEGKELDHLCRVPACTNWLHVEPVTHAENIRRGRAGSVVRARHRAKTHCPAGHAYDEANTYRTPDGRRRCRTCSRKREAVRYHASKKAA